MGYRIWRGLGNAEEDNARGSPQSVALAVWRCRIACSGFGIAPSGCPNTGFRQGFPVARAWAEELGRDLGDCVLMAVMKCL